MNEAAPGLRAPRSIRDGDAEPSIVETKNLVVDSVQHAIAMRDQLEGGNVAIVAADSRCAEIEDELTRRNIEFGRAGSSGLTFDLTVVPVSVVKGLELDGVVVVEPTEIVESELHGMRSLYVALTRSTRRLAVVHARPMPSSMS
jgi:DNA helicase IV